MTDSTAPDEGVVENPYEVVRVKTRSGGHESMTRVAARNRGHEILEGRPALDARGRPLPGKRKTDLTPVDIEGPYDPSGDNVEGVLAKLAEADPAEATRILAAEAAGKNRSSIAAWSPDLAADPTPEV